MFKVRILSCPHTLEFDLELIGISGLRARQLQYLKHERVILYDNTNWIAQRGSQTPTDRQ